MCCRIGNSYKIMELCRFVSGDGRCKFLNKENASACISFHSAVTFEEVIVALLSKSDPLFYGIRWFDTAFSTAHLSTLFQHSPYNTYVSRISTNIVAFFPKTPNSPIRPFCSSFLLHIPCLFLCAGCPPTRLFSLILSRLCHICNIFQCPFISFLSVPKVLHSSSLLFSNTVVYGETKFHIHTKQRLKLLFCTYISVFMILGARRGDKTF